MASLSHARGAEYPASFLLTPRVQIYHLPLFIITQETLALTLARPEYLLKYCILEEASGC